MNLETTYINVDTTLIHKYEIKNDCPKCSFRDHHDPIKCFCPYCITWLSSHSKTQKIRNAFNIIGDAINSSCDFNRKEEYLQVALDFVTFLNSLKDE